MDTDINVTEAIPAMLKITRHAKVMNDRLSEIVNADSTSSFVRSTCSALMSGVTTHVGYCSEDRRIYLLQSKASGHSLEAMLKGPSPTWSQRVGIAKSFASAMGALRRCGVIHLDCRPVNVFVDLTLTEQTPPDPKVTLIDLDGCGGLKFEEFESIQDAWEIPPTTMGRPEDMIRPIWFPWDPTWQTPLAGYFKFAEKWCVINEVWKILSWGVPALGWLEPEHDLLLEAASDVQEMYNASALYITGRQRHEHLLRCRYAIACKIEEVFESALSHTKLIHWQEYGIGTNQDSERFFMSQFALATILSFRDPVDKRLPLSDFGRAEIPSPYWIQNKLRDLLRPYRV